MFDKRLMKMCPESRKYIIGNILFQWAELIINQIKKGEFIKTAIEICTRDDTKENRLRKMMLLRDSLVWVPYNAIFSDADNEAMAEVVLEAHENGEPEISL